MSSESTFVAYISLFGSPSYSLLMWTIFLVFFFFKLWSSPSLHLRLKLISHGSHSRILLFWWLRHCYSHSSLIPSHSSYGCFCVFWFGKFNERIRPLVYYSDDVTKAGEGFRKVLLLSRCMHVFQINLTVATTCTRKLGQSSGLLMLFLLPFG